MNCPEYFMATSSCCKISRLFDKLNIPRHERLLLLEMARDKLDCAEIRRVLNYLYECKKTGCIALL
jgi:hypothetical protein